MGLQTPDMIHDRLTGIVDVSMDSEIDEDLMNDTLASKRITPTLNKVEE